MPKFGQGIPYVPSKNHDDRKPINKNADCLTCMSGHSLFKKEKKKKKKILKDKDLFVMKGNKKSHNIIKGKKRTNGANTGNNKGKSSKLKKGVVKNVQNKAKEIDGSLERKRRKFNKFISKYK